MEPRFDADYDYLFTVFVLGGELVGKSSLIQRYIEGTFSNLEDSPPTVGIDFKLMYTQKSGRKILLQLWDSSGKIKYRGIIEHFISKMMGVILVLDVTNMKSVEQMKEWIDVLSKHANPETQVILLGNKCDQHFRRIVSKDEMLQYAEQMGIVYMECSCKQNVKINQVFDVMINLINSKMKEVMTMV